MVICAASPTTKIMSEQLKCLIVFFEKICSGNAFLGKEHICSSNYCQRSNNQCLKRFKFRLRTYAWDATIGTNNQHNC